MLFVTLQFPHPEQQKNNILSQKLDKRAMNLLTKKDNSKCKISYMRKKYFFCKIISLYTINNICVVIEIIAS